MNQDIIKLKYLIEEYESLCEEAEQMNEAWNSNDPLWAAENDPGLQYEKEQEIEKKYEEIKLTLNSL